MCGFGVLCEHLDLSNWLPPENLIEDEVQTVLLLMTKKGSEDGFTQPDKEVSGLWTPQEKAIVVSEWSEKIRRRGPDGVQSLSFCVGLSETQMIGAVLHIRGPEPTLQPLSGKGNYLVFNGEIFGGFEVAEGENDTQALMKAYVCNLLS